MWDKDRRKRQKEEKRNNGDIGKKKKKTLRAITWKKNQRDEFRKETNINNEQKVHFACVQEMSSKFGLGDWGIHHYCFKCRESKGQSLSLHWQSVRPWFRLPGASEEHGSTLESYSITPKWTGWVEMGHDNKCHQRITLAAEPLQRSSLPQEGCNRGERSQG